MTTRLKRTFAAAAAAVLMLVCTVAPAAAASAVDISIVTSYTVDGEMTQMEGFSVAAFDELGQPITTARPGETVIFNASAPEGYYVGSWSWAASGDNMADIPEMNETISDSMDQMTLVMSDDPAVTEVQAAAGFLPEPPAKGPVKVSMSSAAASGTPTEVMDEVSMKAQNVRLKDIESAEPGQVIIVDADVPWGYHVSEWRASAGDVEVPLTSDGLNETEFEVPVQATDSLKVEAIIAPGLSLLLDLTIDGEASEEYDVLPTAVDENGEPVTSIAVGEAVTISTQVPENYTLETAIFYPYPDNEAADPDSATLDLGTFLSVADNESDPNSVTVTLREMPPLNGIVAVMAFAQPTGLSIITVPENGGTITITPESPQPGDTVHAQAAAADGFILDGWVVSSSPAAALDTVITEDAPNEVTFTMPDAPVTIEADFLPARDALGGLIADSLEMLSSVTVSEDGAELSAGDTWTTPEAAQTFQAAIEAAQAALDAPDSDLVQAIRLLQAAFSTFADSVQVIPTTEVLPEIAEVDGIQIVRGLILSPETGIAPAVASVEAALRDTGAAVKITSADGGELAEGATCATGMIAHETVDDITATVVVWGDVLGTGKVSLSQLTRTASAFIGSNPLEGAYLLAADFDASGKVDLTDLVLAAELYTSYMAAQQDTAEPAA